MDSKSEKSHLPIDLSPSFKPIIKPIIPSLHYSITPKGAKPPIVQLATIESPRQIQFD